MDGFTAFMADISEWAWIAWLVLIAVFLVIEMLTLDFTFLMLSFGGLVGLIGGLLGGDGVSGIMSNPWSIGTILLAVLGAIIVMVVYGLVTKNRA